MKIFGQLKNAAIETFKEGELPTQDFPGRVAIEEGTDFMAVDTPTRGRNFVVGGGYSEQNVQADWNAVSGDAFIRDKTRGSGYIVQGPLLATVTANLTAINQVTVAIESGVDASTVVLLPPPNNAVFTSTGFFVLVTDSPTHKISTGPLILSSGNTRIETNTFTPARMDASFDFRQLAYTTATNREIDFFYPTQYLKTTTMEITVGMGQLPVERTYFRQLTELGYVRKQLPAQNYSSNKLLIGLGKKTSNPTYTLKIYQGSYPMRAQ